METPPIRTAVSSLLPLLYFSWENYADNIADIQPGKMAVPIADITLTKAHYSGSFWNKINHIYKSD